MTSHGPSSKELELVITSALLSDTRTAAATRSIADTFHDAITALTHAKVEYVLAGAMAYGLYAPARHTKDIDLITLDHSKDKLKNALLDAGFKLLQNLPYQLTFIDPVNRVEIDVLLGAVDPEESAVEDAGKATIFGTPTLVIKPEYLLWMYCLSDQVRHEADAIALIKAGRIDLKKFRRFLEYAHDTTASDQFAVILEKLHRTGSSTYSDRVTKRLALQDDRTSKPSERQ